MRIIEKIEPVEKETKEKCGKCKTRFAYTQSDIKPDFRDGNYVVCPSCGAFIAAY